MSLCELPNELWCIIFKMAFPDIETNIETLKASFRVRATSFRFLECVDLYLFSDIRCLEMANSSAIPCSSLPLFTGMSKLCQLDMPQINDETLCLMPWINELNIRNDILSMYDDDDDDGHSKPLLTENGLSGVTSLEILSIHEPTRDQVKAMPMLVNLTTLDLWFNRSVCDKELPLFESLANLHLYEDRMITGVCFSDNKMPCLKKLVISGTSSLVTKHLDHLAPQLEVLVLWDCNVISSSTLKQMSNLKELTLMRTTNDYNEAIRSLTDLRTLRLGGVNLGDDTLMHLTGLTSLDLAHTNSITSKSLAHLATNLTDLRVSYCRRILPPDLLCCTHLKAFSYVSPRDATALDIEAFRVLVDRGVKWSNKDEGENW